MSSPATKRLADMAAVTTFRDDFIPPEGTGVGQSDPLPNPRRPVGSRSPLRLMVQPTPKTVGTKTRCSARFHRRSWTRASVGGRRSYGTLPAILPCHVRSPAGFRSSVARAAPRRAVPNPRPSHRRRDLPAAGREFTAALSTTGITSGRAIRHSTRVFRHITRVFWAALGGAVELGQDLVGSVHASVLLPDATDAAWSASSRGLRGHGGHGQPLRRQNSRLGMVGWSASGWTSHRLGHWSDQGT
jgi:hypothetical protein